VTQIGLIGNKYRPYPLRPMSHLRAPQPILLVLSCMFGTLANWIDNDVLWDNQIRILYANKSKKKNEDPLSIYY